MKPKVIKFHADWCGPCMQLKPVWDEMTPRYADTFEFIEYDVVANPEVQEPYGVQDIPTVLIIQDNEIKRRYIGFPMPLEDRLNKFLENK